MLHLTILPSSPANLLLTRRLQLPFPQILALCDGSHALAGVNRLHLLTSRLCL